MIAITDRGVITIVEVKSEAVRDRDTILVGKTTYPMERTGVIAECPATTAGQKSRWMSGELWLETDPAGVRMPPPVCAALFGLCGEKPYLDHHFSPRRLHNRQGRFHCGATRSKAESQRQAVEIVLLMMEPPDGHAGGQAALCDTRTPTPFTRTHTR